MAYLNDDSPNSFGPRGDVITPSSNDLPPDTRAVVCLTAGNLTIVPHGNDNGDTLAFVGVPAGFIPPYRVRCVTAATATVATVRGDG